MRLHSLPESKQYADDDAEYTEIVRRHRVVLDELRGECAVETLVVIAEDYGPRDSATGWSRTVLIGAWPWRRYRDLGEEDHPVDFYFWVISGLSSSQLDDLLLEAADDRAEVTISNPELEWLYHPYDGGADVILAHRGDRDALKKRHAAWLPAH